MLITANKPVMLSAIMLIVFTLSVVAPPTSLLLIQDVFFVL
jgi:hypothetical protein